MNNISDFELQNEAKTCKSVFEILSHIIIFKPLIKCMFKNELENFEHILSDKSSRERYIKQNIEEIVDFFRDEQNLKKFSEELEKFYLKHERALERTWLDDSHKNAYVMAIATIKEVIKDHERFTVWVNRSSVNLTYILSIKDQIISKFYEIFSQYKEQKIAWDIEWNLILLNDSEEWKVEYLFDKKIIKIGRRYVYADTRKPVIIPEWWWELLTIIYRGELDWKNVIFAKTRIDWEICHWATIYEEWFK